MYMNLGKFVSTRISNIYKFVRHDIWRITGTEISITRRYVYNSIKTLILAIRGFNEDKLQIKASALTYYTLFAIVPIFALLFAIGKGFGFEKVITDTLIKQLSIQKELQPYLIRFVKNYLLRAQKGVFLGIGFGVLIFSVMAGFRQIERTFNEIWQVKKERAYMSQFTIYFSLMLVLPIFIVTSSGLSIFLSTKFSESFLFGLLSPFLSILLKFSPYIINWILFTVLFTVVPNTRVKFLPALVAGIFTGTLFQLFQYLYIKGQVYLTGYNAVYGGFAIIPLLLLWLQTSWLIVLLGAELSFAAQNISNFEFEADSKQISGRYKKFLILVIIRIIIKGFEEGKEPQTAELISKENSIPIRLVSSIINQLMEIGLLNVVLIEKSKEKAYQPAIDINKISVSFLMEKIEKLGSENFKVDKEVQFLGIWNQLEDINKYIRVNGGSTLIKDL